MSNNDKDDTPLTIVAQRSFVIRIAENAANLLSMFLVLLMLVGFLYVVNSNKALKTLHVKVSAEGLEFDENKTKEAIKEITDNTYAVSDLRMAVTTLANQVATLSKDSLTPVPGEPLTTADVKAANFASQAGIQPVDGVVWLGDISSDTVLDQSSTTLTSIHPLRQLSDIQINQACIAKRDLAIRKDFPKSEQRYFLGQPMVGVLKKDQACTILSEPRSYKLTNKTQVWVRIKPMPE
ncbi:MAG TPA: hypothetical protein V6C86_18970 [Oculatellaceae cyanobacterium]